MQLMKLLCRPHGKGPGSPITLCSCPSRLAPLLTAPLAGSGHRDPPAVSSQDPVPSSVTQDGDRTMGGAQDRGRGAPTWCQGPSGESLAPPGDGASPPVPLPPPGREERGRECRAEDQAVCTHVLSVLPVLTQLDMYALTRRSWRSKSLGDGSWDWVPCWIVCGTRAERIGH